MRPGHVSNNQTATNTLPKPEQIQFQKSAFLTILRANETTFLLNSLPNQPLKKFRMNSQTATNTLTKPESIQFQKSAFLTLLRANETTFLMNRLPNQPLTDCE